MQIASNGEIMKKAGYVPQFEGQKLHIDGCMNETVTVTLDADSVRFGGASKDSYKPGAVPDEYSSLGIYDRRGHAQCGDKVSLTFVKPLRLGGNEVTIRQNGQEQSIPVDENGKAWTVMPDGTLKKVQIKVGQEKPSRPDRPHGGHGPERPDRPIKLPDVQTSGIDFRWTKMTITNYNSFLSTSGTGSESVGKYGSYYEQTVIDFANRTITSTKAGKYAELFADEGKGTYWASDVKYSSFSLSFSAASFQMGQLGDTLDKLSAAHNAFRCGDSSEKTDELYEKGVDAAANSFANLFAGFMDKLGGEERRQKIIDSVKEHAHRRDEQYHQAMERHGSRREFRDAVDGRDFERLASLLQEIVRTEMPDILRTDRAPKQEDQRDLYSMYELEYAAVSITAYRGTINAVRENGCGDEMKLALDVSLFEMKLSTLSVRLGVSKEMEEAREVIRDNALDELLAAVDENAEDSAAEALEADTAQVMRRGRHDRFRAVYDKAMDVFRKTGDVADAIREGGREARAHGAEGRYWDEFEHHGPYKKDGLKEYEDDWNRFKDDIGRGRELRRRA